VIVFEIDDIKVSLKKEEELSILEAAKLLGINIPRFCFHDTLSIAGNCRMCLIKLEIPNKPDLDEKFLVSCITRIGPNMRITVNDPIIKKVREEILEFLLLNHPLDCPICDQAGECDLQDQTNFFGSNKSKFYFNKTSINDKNFGVFIKSVMTRCIYCTRCVRFSSEIAGVDFFGTVGRGKHTEISTHPYGFNFFNSELSGNVVDLCPVGALTLKSYSFKARPWELKTLETIDLTDAIGSNVYVNFNENGILRVAPKINSQINNTIITDKARFSYDAFSSFNSLVELKEIKDFKIDDSHSLIFQNLIDNLKKEKLDRTTAIISEELSFESLNLLKTIESIYPNFHVRLINSYLLNKKENINYNLSNRINKIALFDKNIFLICTNPRTEVSLINARLRFVSQKDYYQFYYIGFKNDKEFKNSFFLNFNSKNILNLVQGKAVKLNKLLIESLDSCFLIGASIKSRGININIFSYFIKKFNPRLTIFSFLNNSNSFATNFLKIKSLSSYDIAKSKKIFFLNCRETVFLTRIFLKISFLNKEFFWLNSNKLNFLFKNGFQIPIKNIFEESGVYLNLEGLPQKSNKIVDNKSNALSIFSFFSYIFSIKNSVFKNNFFIKLFLNDLKKFNNNNEFIYTEFSLSSYQFYCKNYLLLVSLRIYKPEIINFFQSNYFTDFSKNLLSATQEFQKNHSNFFN
jgi:NADH-quinone oxidoreductase subunit G